MTTTATTAALTQAVTGYTQPSRVILAAHVRGTTLGLPAAHTTIWLHTHRPDVRDVLTSAAYPRLISAATTVARASGSVGPGSAAAETVRGLVRRLIVHLTTPHAATLHGSTSGFATARQALAVLGAELLRDYGAGGHGRDSILVSHQRLAVRMGVTRLTARSAVQRCVDYGWLREVKRVPGGGVRYRLGRVRGEAACVRAALFMDVIDETVETVLDGGEDDASLPVQLLLRADHPTWGYGAKTDLSRTHWTVAFADGLGIDPTDLGLSARAVSAARRLLETVGIVRGVTDLRGLLARCGAESGATDRARDAELERRAAADARRAAVDDVRRRRAEARAAVAAAIGRAGRVPDLTSDTAARATWAHTMHDNLTVRGADVTREVRLRLERAGWDTPTAARVAERVAG